MNMRRQPAGDAKGISPSITSTRPNAVQSVSESSTPPTQFLAGAGAVAPPLLRMLLKKSLEGSTSITSLFLLKVAL